jgi:hypothetical protein
MAQPWREPLVLALLAFGIVCRLTQYLIDSSFWYDESFVALNVIHKSFGALFGRLDWNEASPPGFLVLEKFVALIFGSTEYALRVPPLIAGLAALLLFAPLARRVCGNGLAMIWALLLFAAWPTAISQAATLKHFSFDMLINIVLLLLAVPDGETTAPPPSRILLWGVAGAGGVWMSFAAVFTFAGTSMVMAAQALRGWSTRQRLAFAAANLITLFSMAALSGPALAQKSTGLMNYWTSHSAFPDTGGIARMGWWLTHSLLAFCGYFWRTPGWIILAIAAVGIITLWQSERRATTLMLLAPIGLAAAASFAHLWPFGGNQHMSFAAPAMLLVIGAGCETLRRRLSRQFPLVGEAALAALLVPVLINSAYRAIYPRGNSDLRTVVEFFQQHRRSGDAVIVSDPATVDFYSGHDFRYESPPITPSRRLWFISIPQLKPRGLDAMLSRRPLLAKAESGDAAALLFGPQAASAVNRQPALSRSSPCGASRMPPGC